MSGKLIQMFNSNAGTYCGFLIFYCDCQYNYKWMIGSVKKRQISQEKTAGTALRSFQLFEIAIHRFLQRNTNLVPYAADCHIAVQHKASICLQLWDSRKEAVRGVDHTRLHAAVQRPRTSGQTSRAISRSQHPPEWLDATLEQYCLLGRWSGSSVCSLLKRSTPQGLKHLYLVSPWYSSCFRI